MMFRGRIQRPSFFSTVPDGPNLLKVHFVTYNSYIYVICPKLRSKSDKYFKTKNGNHFVITFGKTAAIGSILSSWGSSDMARTSLPYVVNSPPRKKSMK